MKDILGYERRYAVTEDGRVWSYAKTLEAPHGGFYKTRGKFLKPNISGRYTSVSLSSRTVRARRLIHRLVAQAFIPNPNNLPQVNHKDADKRNNHYTNLEWVTAQGNSEHAAALGLFHHPEIWGENHPFAKMNEWNVIEARRLHIEGWSLSRLATKYGIGLTTIHAICAWKTWKYIEAGQSDAHA